MARLRKDETGKRYGKLTVIQFNAMNKNGDALWLCRCDCGKDSVVIGCSLRNGQTKSCGCLRGHCNPTEILSTRINEAGNKYGRLTVIKFDGMHKKQTSWQCQCECGNTVTVTGYSLRSGNTKSCGCLNREGNNLKHGLVTHPIYIAYHAARTRCTNPNQNDWHNYGGRGIEFRLGSFEEFYAAMNGSWFKGSSIGRIDPEGNYEYGNVRWETNEQQARGRRNNVWYTHDGLTMIMADWAAKIGITPTSLLERVNKWGIKEALSRPRKALSENRPHR